MFSNPCVSAHIRQVARILSQISHVHAGCRLAASGTLAGLLNRIAATGLVSTRTRGTVAEWTHPGTLAALGVAATALSGLRRQPMCNGAVVGIVGERARRQVLDPWVRCALQQSCIAPRGSSHQNHRQDQAVLTVLANLNGFGAACRVPEGIWSRATPGSPTRGLVFTPGPLGLLFHQDGISPMRRASS